MPPPSRRPALAVFSARRAALPWTLWGLVFGGTVSATMTTYRTTFPTEASRANLVRSFQGNPAFEAIFGLTRHMDTVAGYTAYKTLFTMIILGAVWGLLRATAFLRGEEDAGRYELLLAGPTTRGRAAAQVLAGLAVGLVALWVPTALFTVAGGRSADVGIGTGAALFFATAAVAGAAMFVAVGALASQLAGNRHGANLIGAGVLAGAYLIRMAADSDPRIGWLRWASPIGWVEELRPLTGSHWVAFVPIAAFTVGALAAALALAARRDVGAGALGERRARPARLGLLGGHGGLSLRLAAPGLVAWSAGLAATGLVLGLVTQAAGQSLQGSPTLERVMGRLGATHGGAATYLGYIFVTASALIGVAVAGQVNGLRTEEAEGRLDNLVVGPVDRRRWLAVRLAVAAGLAAGGGVLTGVAAWAGAATQHAAIGFGDLVEAGVNVVPPALFVLGAGALVFGLRPRAAAAVTYGIVVWSFLVEILAAVAHAGQWLRDTSPFLHIAPAPAAPPDWTAAAWLVGLGLLAAAAGLAAFNRRDIQPA